MDILCKICLFNSEVLNYFFIFFIFLILYTLVNFNYIHFHRSYVIVFKFMESGEISVLRQTQPCRSLVSWIRCMFKE